MVLFLTKSMRDQIFRKMTYMPLKLFFVIRYKVKIFTYLYLKVPLSTSLWWALSFLFSGSLYIPSRVGALSAFPHFKSACKRPPSIIHKPSCGFLNNTLLWPLSTLFNVTEEKKIPKNSKSSLKGNYTDLLAGYQEIIYFDHFELK